MKDGFIVEQDKSVVIKGIYQWPTYGGLLEGLPTERINNNILQNLPGDIRRHCGSNAFHIIRPEQTPIPYEGIYPFGQPMALPDVTCIADLSFGQPVRSKDRQGSALIVAWFQKGFLFPVDPDILEKLKNLEWSKLAFDFDY